MLVVVWLPLRCQCTRPTRRPLLPYPGKFWGGRGVSPADQILGCFAAILVLGMVAMMVLLSVVLLGW